MRELIAPSALGVALLGLALVLAPVLRALPRQEPSWTALDREDWRFTAETFVWDWERYASR